MKKLVWSVFVVAALLMAVGIGLGAAENGSVGAGLFFAGAVLAIALWVGSWMVDRDE